MEQEANAGLSNGQEASKESGAKDTAPATIDADPPRKFDPDYERLVADLFAQYKPQTVVEDAALVTIALALRKKCSRDANIANDRALDKKIATALEQLSQSEVARCRHGAATAAGSGKSRWRSAAPRMPQRQRQASPQEALKFWTPEQEGLPAEAQTVKEDPLVLAQRDFEEAQRRYAREKNEEDAYRRRHRE